MNIITNNGITYNRVIVQDTNNFLDEIQKEQLCSKIIIEKACLPNSYEAAKISNSTCVEGFVICKTTICKSVVGHCWNKKDGVYFDVNKDLIWVNYPIEQEFLYYPIAEFGYKEYEEVSFNEISFKSDAIEIAKVIDNSPLLNQI